MLYPSLTPDQVKAILMKSASKTFPQYSITLDPATGITYVSQYDVFTVGAGYLDLQAALNVAATPPPSGATMISPLGRPAWPVGRYLPCSSRDKVKIPVLEIIKPVFDASSEVRLHSSLSSTHDVI
jgi:hypothetical protein